MNLARVFEHLHSVSNSVARNISIPPDIERQEAAICRVEHVDMSSSILSFSFFSLN